ncbi:DUF2924 domain-containing protein [Sphingomonas sp. LY54]|uniref:DUF2924 domain-containing protein n=1 Tax=Sphingomonas sp. LY54 TaxID=3095343 RepID=UPI002D7653A7|nr:DUF2924 domain-containing protein [Sphingomonas sp. LY54]WRP29794.1 DUF2924 domain-containing protein [Sphingomonas sp. LY54]
MMDERLLAQLAQADLEKLRKEWERRYGAAPRLRSPALLRRILIWRIQAATEGGLDWVTRRLLVSDASPENLMAEGSVITREWKGMQHQVEVADGGYFYNGRRWKSLSEVARKITGTRWNGPRFFGLRDAE